MATGKRYYWLKLKDSFMTSDSVDFLMGQPNGANYVVLYQMLCLKTINTGGKLSRQIGEIIIPYDEQKIARDCKWFTVDTVRVALNLYKALGLIYQDVDGTLVLADHDNLVGSETDYAERNRRLRANRKEALPVHDVYSDVSNDVSQNVCTDIEIDKDIDIRDRDKILEKDNREKSKRFMPPTLDEVKAYCESRGNKVDAKRFYDYFSAGNWIDSKGNKVRNWKQKLITWENSRGENANDKRANSRHDQESSGSQQKEWYSRNLYDV